MTKRNSVLLGTDDGSIQAVCRAVKLTGFPDASLNESNPTDGGFLVQTDFVNDLLEDV